MRADPTPSDPPDSTPPEAELIRRLREAMTPPLSPEAATGRMASRISGKRWRDIEAGHDQHGKPTRPRAATLADMAAVVGATPEDLAGIGRQDAAEVLARQGGQASETLLRAIRESLNDIRGDRRLSRAQRVELERVFIERVTRDVGSAKGQIDEMLKIIGEPR